MIKAFFLIFEPGVSWSRVAQARRGVLFILMFHLLPMMVLVAGVESWGLVTMGKWQPAFQRLRNFHEPASTGLKAYEFVVVFEVVQFLLTLVMVFVAAFLVKAISRTFREGSEFRQAFAVVAYGLSPMFLLRLLDALPMVNPWIPWGIGISLTLLVLYLGVPCVLRPDPAHAFGLYLNTNIVMIFATGVVRMLTAWYLLGTVDASRSHLFQKIGSLLGL